MAVILKLITLIMLGAGIMNFTGAAKATEPEVVTSAVWQKVADELEFPEGPAWDGERYVYFSNCRGNWIGQTDGINTTRFLKTTSDTPVFGKTNGLTFYHGYLFACDFGLPAILKIALNGVVETYINSINGKPLNRPNDLAFDRQGNLFFTDPAEYNCDKPDGRVVRIAANAGTVTIVQDSMAFPNGIAFSPDEKFLYVAESACERVVRFKVSRRGTLIDKRIFVNLPGGDPDGLAVDAEGNLYIAHFGGGAVFVVNPEGKIIRRIIAPGKKPSNLEFAGPDSKTLYMTEVETNTLYRLPVKIPGLPLPH